jgi:hypothetical protein
MTWISTKADEEQDSNELPWFFASQETKRKAQETQQPSKATQNVWVQSTLPIHWLVGRRSGRAYASRQSKYKKSSETPRKQHANEPPLKEEEVKRIKANRQEKGIQTPEDAPCQSTDP